MPEIPTTTRGLTDRLERYYVKAGSVGAGGLFVPEVGLNGIYGAGRRCDALYVGFTSSSGRALVGHEIKVSVADWRHELDLVEKADQWSDACHEWWVVAPSTKIVDPTTLPDGWGLMVPNARGSVRFDRVVRARSRGPEFTPPWWAVRSMMARHDTLTAGLLGRMSTAAAERLRTEEKEREARWAKAAPDRRLTREERQVLEKVEELTAAGVDITDWRVPADKLAAVWPTVLAGVQAETVVERLAGKYAAADNVLRLATDLHRAVEALRAGRDVAGSSS